MAFLKKATLNIKSVYAADNDGKFQWRDFVKQANETPSNDRTKFLPPEAYNFDTKNFLFLTARAISGMEKHGYNGNYDAFPWEEIKKALPTYPGVGFYIEHKEDSEADAKGIVLDAIPNEEENFVICLCAIDKNEYPEFVQQILDGTYNQVSMSCLASTCECSKCHNVATSFDNLCEHMNPNNPITYCKGKVDENGNVVYEINRDLCFTGLSAVEVPADKDAFVFDIKASKNKQNKLKEEFAKYTKLKQAGKMKEFKMACEENFKAMDNFTLLNKLRTLTDNITNTINTEEQNTPLITVPLQGIVKQLMELQIGLSIMDLNKLTQKEKVKEQPVEQSTNQEPLTMIEDEAENFGEQHQEEIEEVNLDKEIDSYLDGDNYSYTPFSSTAKIKKKAGTWAIPDTKEKVQKLKNILKEPLPASKTHSKIDGLIGDDELSDEIDDYLETEPNEAMNNVIKYHLKRIQKCPLNRKSYNTKEEYKEALESQKLWDIILEDY